MERTEALNKHLINNKSYYEGVCFNLYNGRYLWEDLFQEFCIKFLTESEGLDFNRDVRKYGTSIIYRIFYNKDRKKTHQDGSTSPLFECSGFDYDKEAYFFEANRQTDLKARARAEQHLMIRAKKAQYLINKKLQSDNPKEREAAEVFVKAQEQYITDISKEKNKHRNTLNYQYKKVQEYLKREI